MMFVVIHDVGEIKYLFAGIVLDTLVTFIAISITV